ncbi:MAG: hypothetical protein JWM05_1151 [Acidimicrobiales bacterium]|nr:hypothetical protein [Acidimicrobiales bacterium]
MGTRPLRQLYDHDVTIEVDAAFGPVVEPWLRHRHRFGAALDALSDQQWDAPSRCDAWSVRDVVTHLSSADGFWVVSLQAAQSGAPSTYLAGFDPTTTPEALVAGTRGQSVDDIRRQFAEGTERLVAAVQAVGDDGWGAVGEAPVGHVPARLVLAHALWDSWLHERDVLLPLGIEPPVEADELLVSTWYTLVMGALQGGLLDDPEPVGPGPSAPIEASLRFDDLPHLGLRVAIDAGVRITAVDPADAEPAGSAVDFVEAVTGRAGGDPLAVLPAPLADQLGRAAQIL